jgi:hypothetical protein
MIPRGGSQAAYEGLPPLATPMIFPAEIETDPRLEVDSAIRLTISIGRDRVVAGRPISALLVPKGDVHPARVGAMVFPIECSLAGARGRASIRSASLRIRV